MAARKPTLAAEISALIGDRLDRLDHFTSQLATFDTRLGVMQSELTHMRGSLDEIAGKLGGNDGVEKRLRLLEDAWAGLKFVSHPIFVGLAMLLMGGLLTNGFTSWRQLGVLTDHVARLEQTTTAGWTELNDVVAKVHRLEAVQAYYHGRDIPAGHP